MHDRGVIGIALAAMLSAALLQSACSSSSEQKGGDGAGSAGLKAKLVYYAIPG